MQTYVIKSHNLVKKRHKIINLCDKKSQPSEKKNDENVNLCDKRS